MLPAKTKKCQIECTYFTFFPTPYIIAPIVYIIPPDNNRYIPPISTASNKGLNVKIITHPIDIYKIMEITLYFSTLIAFNTIPIIADAVEMGGIYLLLSGGIIYTIGAIMKKYIL